MKIEYITKKRYYDLHVRVPKRLDKVSEIVEAFHASEKNYALVHWSEVGYATAASCVTSISRAIKTAGLEGKIRAESFEKYAFLVRVKKEDG